jgi:hypothetical protein
MFSAIMGCLALIFLPRRPTAPKRFIVSPSLVLVRSATTFHSKPKCSCGFDLAPDLLSQAIYLCIRSALRLKAKRATMALALASFFRSRLPTSPRPIVVRPVLFFRQPCYCHPSLSIQLQAGEATMSLLFFSCLRAFVPALQLYRGEPQWLALPRYCHLSLQLQARWIIWFCFSIPALHLQARQASTRRKKEKKTRRAS